MLQDVNFDQETVEIFNLVKEEIVNSFRYILFVESGNFATFESRKLKMMDQFFNFSIFGLDPPLWI